MFGVMNGSVVASVEADDMGLEAAVVTVMLRDDSRALSRSLKRGSCAYVAINDGDAGGDFLAKVLDSCGDREDG